LECAPEKPLVFAHSPYQTEPLLDDEGNPEGSFSYTFTGEDIFYLRKTARAELYRNTVRLKINLPIALEKQEIWRYDDPPVLYDDSFKDTPSSIRLSGKLKGGIMKPATRLLRPAGKKGL
jgi:hypothetical protein